MKFLRKFRIKEKSLLLFIYLFNIGIVYAEESFLVAPAQTETDSTITLVWKYADTLNSRFQYHIYLNCKEIASTIKTNFTISHLKPNTEYNVIVKARDNETNTEYSFNPILVRTKNKHRIHNIVNYGARAIEGVLNTKSIQKAINACKPGDIVYIPQGVFECGSIHLKSNMTLYVSKNAVLKGSNNPVDYLPFSFNRFEGWEVLTYQSLINVGTLNSTGEYNIENVSIRGCGKIIGGGSSLADGMINEKGLRGRGKLISIMNCNNFNIQGLTLEESPCWTIHYVFSKNVTCHDLNILSTTHNGDGIDPDSSLNSYIFNCTFSTNDDCIAIKSGKNPEGNKVNIPCENIYISDCIFLEGHSLAIGSEVSGGIKNVYISNCKLGDLRFGLQIKTTDKRGGYVKNVDVSNCDLNQIKIVTSVNYNNDGEAAPDFTVLSDLSFRNINMINSKRKDIIVVEGFKNGSDNLKNVKFVDVRVPIKSVISMSNASNISIKDITSVYGQSPEYLIKNCTINNLEIHQ